MRYFPPKPSWLMPMLAFALLAIPAWAMANPTVYNTTFTPLNGSGVSGTATATLDGNMLTVHISASGLETDQVHPQHIHGAFDSSGDPTQSTTPTQAVDNPANGGNGDGIIELGEGATTYGPILIPLTSPPGGALSGFPTAPNGTIDFTQQYDLSSSGIYNDGYDMNDLLPLDLREIVLHGLSAPKPFDGVDANGNPHTYETGEYDPVLPVASGVLSRVTAVPGPSSIIDLATGLLLLLGVVGLRRARIRRTNHS